jgi:hypothetical protein
MNRFYPEEFPEFDYEPTKDEFDIVPIEGNIGVGVIAKRRFKPGEIVFRFTGVVTNKITLFTLQKKKGEYIHDPWFMGRILHRCEPNCSVDMNKLEFRAIEEINEGDWITMDYDQTEDVLFRPFECHCGKVKCSFSECRTVKGRLVAETIY